MPFNRWVDKSDVAYLYNEILYSTEKKSAIRSWDDIEES